MKKIYLVVAGAFLILLVITTMLLSLTKKPTISNQKNFPSPTSIPDRGTNKDNIDVTISTIAPVETTDFKLQYSSQLNKIVVEQKTPQAQVKFADWANQNNYLQLISDKNQVVFLASGEKIQDNHQMFLNFVNIFLNMGQGDNSSSTCTGQACLTPTLNPSSVVSPPPSSFAYFPQCGDLGDLSLPSGCNLCQAGCGPTAVSMIAASYLGSNYDPKAIVNIYRSNGYLLGCDGSRYSDAKQVLQGLGLKTTDYLVFNSEKSDAVVPDLRKYLASGWTFFTLASFCEGGCGHYFWITDIDSQGNIWAYDPAYGRYEIPYNENTRYPYPLYRLAFGVKK